MKQKIHIVSVLLSIVVGSVLVIGFAWIMGDKYATALFPVIALLSGFVATGVVIGWTSKGVTIVEPGLGSIIVAIIAYFVISSMDLRGLDYLQLNAWVMILLNGVILTFLGAWLGEQLQHGDLDPTRSERHIEWGWVVAGSVLGVVSSMVLVNILVWILGPNPSKFYIPFFLSLIITGLVIGWKSPGVTIKEAGLAGLLTITALLDVVFITIIPVKLTYLLGAIVIGFALTYVGGYIGEKIQGTK